MTQPDFIIIPTQLLSDDLLHPSDRILFGYIYWMQKLALMKCIASNETLSELTGFSVRQIRRSLDQLEKRGYIGRIYRGVGQRNREEIIVTVAFSAFGSSHEGHDGPSRGTKRVPHEGHDGPHNKIKEKEHLKRTNRTTKKNVLNADDYPELQPEIGAFIEARQAMRKPLVSSSLKLLIDKLERWYPSNTKAQRQCLEESIINGWQGVFQLKGEMKPKSDISPAQVLHPEKYGRPSSFAAQLSKGMDVSGKVPPR